MQTRPRVHSDGPLADEDDLRALFKRHARLFISSGHRRNSSNHHEIRLILYGIRWFRSQSRVDILKYASNFVSLIRRTISIEEMVKMSTATPVAFSSREIRARPTDARTQSWHASAILIVIAAFYALCLAYSVDRHVDLDAPTLMDITSP